MYHPRVSGTYFEMGQRYGAGLHKHGFGFPELPRERIEFAFRSGEPSPTSWRRSGASRTLANRPTRQAWPSS